MVNPLKIPIVKTSKMSTPERQLPSNFEDYVVRKAINTKEAVTGDHDADGDKPQMVNVVYGTDATPPTASTVPIGTIYIQYTA